MINLERIYFIRFACILLALSFFLPVRGMQFQLDKHLAGCVNKKEYDTVLAKLDNTIDGNIIRHLTQSDDNYWETTQNLKHFLSVNKSLRALSSNVHLTAFLITQLVKQKEMPFMAAALQLATPGARALVNYINKTDPESYSMALKEASKSPLAQSALRGLLACDINGIAFKGLPRITVLMIAIGYKNQQGVAALLNAARKRSILSSYINMQCPEDTSTFSDWCATDSDLDFYCFGGETALHIASAGFNHVPLCLMEKLLKAGADPNAENKMGSTSLVSALTHGQKPDFEKASLLIEYGANREKLLEADSIELKLRPNDNTLANQNFLKTHMIKIR